MQLMIEVNDQVADKVLYFLENLKSDVKIIKKLSPELDIEIVSKDDLDYIEIENARKERKKSPKDYISIDEVNWD